MSLDKKLFDIASTAVEQQRKARDSRNPVSKGFDVATNKSYSSDDKKVAAAALRKWENSTWKPKVESKLKQEMQARAPHLKPGSKAYKQTYDNLFNKNYKDLQSAKAKAQQQIGTLRKPKQTQRQLDNDYRTNESVRNDTVGVQAASHAARDTVSAVGGALATGTSRLLRAPLQLAADVGENDDGGVFDRGAKALESYEDNLSDNVYGAYGDIQQDGSFSQKLAISAVEQVPALAASFGVAGAAAKGVQALGAGAKTAAAASYGTAAASMYPQAYLDGSDSTKDELEGATAQQLASAERSQDIYKGMFDKNVKAGMSEDDAHAKARDQTISEIAEESGDNVGLATLALSMLAPGVGSFAANRAAGGAVSSWGQKVFNKLAVRADAGKVAKYAIPTAVGAGIVGLNVAEEGLQEGYTDYVAQQAAVDIGVKDKIDEDQSREAILMGGILGGLMGGGAFVGTRNSKLHQAQDDLKTAQQAYAEVASQIPQLQEQIDIVSPRSEEGQVLTARLEETKVALDNMAAAAQQSGIPRTSLARRAPRIEPTNSTGQNFDGGVDGSVEIDAESFDNALNPQGEPVERTAPVIDTQPTEQELDAQDAQLAELIAEQQALDDSIEDNSAGKPVEESIAAAQSWYEDKRGENKAGLSGVVSRAAAKVDDTAFAEQQQAIAGTTTTINDYIATQRAQQQQIDAEIEQAAIDAKTEREKKAVEQLKRQREIDRAQEDELIAKRAELAQPYEGELFDTTIVGADGTPFNLARFWDSTMPAAAKTKLIANAFDGQVEQNIAKADWSTLPEGVQRELHRWMSAQLEAVRQERGNQAPQEQQPASTPVVEDTTPSVTNGLAMPTIGQQQPVNELTDQNPVINIPAPSTATNANQATGSKPVDKAVDISVDLPDGVYVSKPAARAAIKQQKRKLSDFNIEKVEGGYSLVELDTNPVGKSASNDVAIGKDGQAKWFGSNDKAQAFIDKNGISDTHSVVSAGKSRFEIQPKQAVKVDAPQANEVESETVAASPIEPPQSSVAKQETASEGDTKDRFADNTLFTADKVAAARARMKSKMGRVNSGLDPELLVDGVTIAGAYIESGVRKFGDYAKAMIDDFGADITPYLSTFWEGVRRYPGLDTEGMTSTADSDAEFKKLMAEYEQESAPAKPKYPKTLGTGDKVDTFVGENEDGKPLYEDKNGVRAISESGIMVREAVSVTPTGLQRTERRDNYLTTEELAQKESENDTGTSNQNDRSSADTGLPSTNQADAEGRNAGRPQAESTSDMDAVDGAGAGSDTIEGDGDSRPTTESQRSVADDSNSRTNSAQSNDGATETTDAPPTVTAKNHVIDPADSNEKLSWQKVAERNVSIVELIKTLDSEDRQASASEQALLAKYAGWGASEVANGIFPNPQTGKYKSDSWQALGEKLKSLLTDSEYDTARRTTQYAHYTPPVLVGGIYKALEQFGFKGGQVLEPASGIGVFNGLMPKALASNSSYVGLELDPITGRIAQYLYPESNMKIDDYIKAKLPDNHFDVAVGNPPFAGISVDYKGAGKNSKKQSMQLHDYFFAKTLDKLKPGGVMAFVTSKGTMDKKGSGVREYLAEQADLIGAIRLPQTAFKENAGTEVVTDIIFLRKRHADEQPSDTAWANVKTIQASGKPTAINEYFVNNPEMVLGEHAIVSGRFGDTYTVQPNKGDFTKQVNTAISKLPKDIFNPTRGSQAEAVKVMDMDYGQGSSTNKEGGVYLKDGQLMRVVDGVGKPLTQRYGTNGKPIDLSDKDIAFMTDYVGVRDALKQSQHDQLNDSDTWEDSLANLNTVYDAFVKKHGPLMAHSVSERENNDGTVTVTKRFKNKQRLFLDVEGVLASALENVVDDGKGTVEKGSFFSGRSLRKPKMPTIKGTQDAMVYTLDEKGVLDIDRIAGLVNKSRDQIIEELGDQIYQDPQSKEWDLAETYLSGNVVAKLEAAEKIAKTNKAYSRNVAALKAVQPAPIAPNDISSNMGAAWIPGDVIGQFSQEVLAADVKASYSSAVGLWDVGGSSRSSDYATADRSTVQLVESILNNRSIVIKRKTADGETFTDSVATELANEVARKIKTEFKKWLWSDDARTQELADYYNKTYNNIVPPSFNGDHLTLAGMSNKIQLRAPQKQGIYRVIRQGDVYLNHAVGAGKTFTMIAAAMEEKRLGLINKPMFVVPNHMLDQFSQEFLMLYPAANIMVADEQNFHTHNRKQFVAQAALNTPDAIIITHSGFERIGVKPDTKQAFLKNKIEEWQAALEATKESDGDNRTSVKQLERNVESLERNLDELLDAKEKDGAVYFEDMGIDKIYIDEAHEFRKLNFVTKMGNIKGIDPAGSQRAMDLDMKLQLLRQTKPTRAFVGASGTPVTNTMGELYTIQRYFQPDQLSQDGLDHFDVWANQFGEVVEGLEQNAAGNYEVVPRFAKFVNVPELMSRVRSFMDVLTSNDLSDFVVRPSVRTGGREIVTIPTPDGFSEYQKSLSDRIDAIRRRSGKPEKGDDIILSVIGDGRFSAIDMRFVDPTLPSDPNSKLNTAIRDMAEAYHATENNEYTTDGATDKYKGGALMMFTDIGLGEQSTASRGFDMKAWINDELVRLGVKPEHIAFMRDNKTHAKKGKLFDDMRQGRKRIMIGGKDMETGVNAQKRLTHLFHLDAPWFPASVEQREGRIIRQGNQNQEVVIKAYATKGSYDSTMWSMVARKARFIEQAMRGDATVRSMDDVSEASAFEQASALSSGDPRSLQLAGLRQDVERLNRQLSGYQNEKFKNQNQAKAARRTLARAERELDDINKLLPTHKTIATGDVIGQVNSKAFDSRADFGQAIIAEYNKHASSFVVGEKVLGTAAGYDVVYNGVMMDGGNFYADANINIPKADDAALFDSSTVKDTNPDGLTTRIVNRVNRLAEYKDKVQAVIEQAQTDAVNFERRASKSFDSQAELVEKSRALKDLEDELSAESEALKAASQGQVFNLTDADRVPGSDAKYSRQSPKERMTLQQAQKQVLDELDLILDAEGMPISDDQSIRDEYFDRIEDLLAGGDFNSAQSYDYTAGLPDENKNTKNVLAVKNPNKKAPNGKPSNLSDQQWAEVRTPAFKEWFGDWENDAANASKIVDENGEPLVVYHGTVANFSSFDITNMSRNTGNEGFYGSGFYFSSDKSEAAQYGENLIESYLNIRNPFFNTQEYLAQFAEDIGFPAGENISIVEDITEDGLEGAQFTENLIKKGYDGVWANENMLNDVDEIVIFKANQVKSSTKNVGTFDRNTDDIRYSKTNPAKGSTGVTAKQVIGILQNRFGKDVVASLIKKGILRIRPLNDFVDTDGRLLVPSDAEGFYYDGKVTLIADNLTSETAVPTLLHELGGHAGIQNLLSESTYMKIMGQFDALVEAGNKHAVEAKRRADASTVTESEARDEYIPYLITEYAQTSERSGPIAVIKRFVNRVMAGVRAWVRNHTGVDLKMTPNDITQLAERMVNRLANQGAIDSDNAINAIDVPLESSQSTENQIDTPAFKEWFGDSKVVDSNGDPLVVYHGTNADFSVFNISDVGIHVGTQDQANSRQSEKGGQDFKVMALYASIENPLRLSDSPSWKDPLWYVQKSGIAKHLSSQLIDNIIDFQEQLKTINLKSVDGQKQAASMAMRVNKDVASELKAKGYDGIVYKNTHDGTSLANKMKGDDAWIVFDPNQIKSATENAGTFDATNNDIRFSRRYSNLGVDTSPTTTKAKAIDAAKQSAATALSSKFTLSLLLRRHLATPLHVGMLNPSFKTFFENVQARIAYENNEAGRIQEYMPEIWDTRLMVGKKREAIDKVSRALFDGTMADRVWEDTDLETRFNLDANQIDMYRRAREAIDQSVRNMTVDTLSSLAKGTKLVNIHTVNRLKLAGFDPIDHNLALQQHMTDELQRLAQSGSITPAAVTRLQNQLDSVFDVMGSVSVKYDDLVQKGYAPLMRFGHYAVEVRDKSNNQLDLFELYETKGQQRKAINELKQRYDANDFEVGTGTLNPDAFKQFTGKGLSPETVQLFAAELGLDTDGAHQAYLKIAISNQSALKRLIHRKKVPGYSEDLPRVLSAFVMSNARYSGRALYNGEIERSIQKIEDGNLQGEAQNVFGNMENPQEEFAGVRGLLFHYYMGFSTAFMVLNFTQPLTQTIPKLTAYVGVARAHRDMTQALGIITKYVGKATLEFGKDKIGMGNVNWNGFEDSLPAWVRREDYLRMTREGHLDPQNIWMIRGLERGKAGVISGLWGNLSRAAGWAAEVSETINRRGTMIAAFKVAQTMGDVELKAKGFNSRYDFAVSVIQQTQGVYNKGNRSGLARGNGKLGQFGPLVMVFKQFSINYVEQMVRHGRDKEAKSIAVAMTWQFLLAGALGLPFTDDLRDLVEGLLYRIFGRATNLVAFLQDELGKENADALMYGLLSEKTRFDMYGRSNMGNFIPGTDFARPQEGDWAEVVGASSGFFENFFTAASNITKGQYKDAAIVAAPRYVRDAAAGVEIWNNGAYRNQKGDKVMDMDRTDAVIKGAFQFNPASNAQQGRERSEKYHMKNMVNDKQNQFALQLTEAIYQEDDERLDKIYKDMDAWNDRNPEHFNVDIDKIEESADRRISKKEFTSEDRQKLPAQLDEYFEARE